MMNLEIPPQGEPLQESNPNLALFRNLRGEARTRFFTGLTDKEVLALHQQLKPFDNYTPEELDRLERIGRQALESSSFALQEEGRADFTQGRERVETLQDLKIQLAGIDEKIGAAKIKLEAGDREQVKELINLRTERAGIADDIEKLSPQLGSRDARMFAGSNENNDLPMFEFQTNKDDEDGRQLN